MMKLSIFILLLLAWSVLYAQDSDHFRNFHGIKQERNHYFEAEGYEIYIRTAPYYLNEKGITKIIKQYDMKDSQRTDTLIGNEAIMLVKKEVKHGFELVSVCYLISKDDYSTTVIGFAGFNRNLSLEHLLMQAWLDGTIPKNIYTTPIVGDSFDFIGRKIKLGGTCQWMSPHNIQCPNNGQMSWSLFNSEEAAMANRDLHVEIVKNKNLTSVLEDTWVPVTFEGVQVKARKLKVKINVPKLIMGGSNILIVYYITANVRDHYVTCALSQYTDDAADNTLAGLLQEVMSLDE